MRARHDRLSQCTILAITVIMLGVVPPTTQAQCTFTYIRGKYQADCASLGFTSVPRDLPTNIQVMVLSGNTLTRLPYDTFHDYYHIVELDFKNNQIASIHNEAFLDRDSLARIDLSENRLTKLVNRTFQDLLGLRYINLQGNQIRVIEDGAFSNLPLLEEVNLQNCGLEYMAPHSFVNIGDRLTTLNLAHNSLTTLSQEIELATDRRFRRFYLYDNPFNCDCKMRWIRNWMASETVSFSYGGGNEPRCYSPRKLRGRTFTSLHPIDFACRPNMLSRNSAKLKASGTKLSLYCNVTGDPYPAFFWSRNGVSLFGRKRYKITSSGNVRGNITSKVEISETSVNDSGTYQCEASNTAGVVEVEFVVKIFLEKAAGEPQNIASQDGGNGGLGNGSIAAIAVSAVLFIVIIATFTCYVMKVRNAKRKRMRKKRQAEDELDSEDKIKPDLIQHEQDVEVRSNLLPVVPPPPDFETELREQNYSDNLYQSRQRGPVMGQITSEAPLYTSMQKVKASDVYHGNNSHGNTYPSNRNVTRDPVSNYPSLKHTNVLPGSRAQAQRAANMNRESQENLANAPRKPPRTYASEEHLDSESCSSLTKQPFREDEEYGTAV